MLRERVRRALEYRERMMELEHAGVVRMWEAIKAGRSLPGWPPGKELEHTVLRAFELEGAEVTWPYVVLQQPGPRVLEEVDGAVHFDGLSCLVECKRSRRRVSVLPIVKLKAQLMRRPRETYGAVFCTTNFTETAVRMVWMLPPANVLLWDGEEIDVAIREQRLREWTRRKVKYAKEQGMAIMRLYKKGAL